MEASSRTCDAHTSLATSPSTFLEEQKYLKNVTPATLSWYHQVFRSFSGCSSEPDFKGRIVELRQRGVSAISVNSWLRGVNAYLRWSGAGFKLPKLKEEKALLQTFSPKQISTLLAPLPSKLRTRNNLRAQALIALLLDTGLRISEALQLRREDVDLDALTLRVWGKGRKERRVPLSLEGRRWMYGWMRQRPSALPSEFVWSTRVGTHITLRNAERDILALCQTLKIDGVRRTPHTLRHTVAVSYLRGGGNLEYLRRILGHTSLTTTQKYLRSLGVEDLREVHDGLSPLSLRR